MDRYAVMPSTGSKKPRFFYGYIIVLVVFLAIAVFEGIMYSFGVFLKPLIAEFGWTRAMTSGAYSLHFFLWAVLAVVAGRLNDKFGPRRVATVCGVLFGLGHILMSQISTLWQLYLLYGVMIAMGMSGGFVPLTSTVARWFTKRRGVMTGITISGVGVGVIVVPPLASHLIVSYGWRTSYLIIGVAALALITLAAQFLRRDPAQMGLLPYGEGEVEAESPNLEAEGASLLQAIRTGQFWMLGAIFFCQGFGQLVAMTHIVPHATDLGISAIVAANILAIIGGVSIAGRIGIGRASDRIGNKLSFIISFILFSVAFLWLLVTKELWMFHLFAVIFGLAYGGLVTLMSPVVAELFGLRAHGAILGTIFSIHLIGCAIGSLMAGWIFDITSSYHLAFLVCAILSIIALIITSRLKPARGEGYEKARLF